MGQPDIYLQVIALIEKNTDMPITQKALETWLEDAENRKIYRLYKLAYDLRNNKEGGIENGRK